MEKTKIVLATSNADKVKEMADVLSQFGLRWWLKVNLGLNHRKKPV